MKKYNNEDIDRLKDSISIEEVIFSLTGTKVRRGKNFRCINPEHSDTNPSMGIIPGKEVCHCFTCGYSADAIKLIRDLEKKNYLQSIERLAEITGNPYWFKPITKHSTKKQGCPVLFLTKEELNLIKVYLPFEISKEIGFREAEQCNTTCNEYIVAGDAGLMLSKKKEPVGSDDFGKSYFFSQLVLQKASTQLEEIAENASKIKHMPDSVFETTFQITQPFLNYYGTDISCIKAQMLEILRNKYSKVQEILKKVDVFQKKYEKWKLKTPKFLQ